jgi:hypothetical protein
MSTLIDSRKSYTETVEQFINSYKTSWYATSPGCIRMIAEALEISTLNTGNDDYETCYKLVESVYFGS